MKKLIVFILAAVLVSCSQEQLKNIDIEKTSYSEASYIKEIGYIKYLHELQAVLRIYHIDQGILSNKLWVDNSLPGVDWVNDKIK